MASAASAVVAGTAADDEESVVFRDAEEDAGAGTDASAARRDEDPAVAPDAGAPVPSAHTRQVWAWDGNGTVVSDTSDVNFFAFVNILRTQD